MFGVSLGFQVGYEVDLFKGKLGHQCKNVGISLLQNCSGEKGPLRSHFTSSGLAMSINPNPSKNQVAACVSGT